MKNLLLITLTLIVALSSCKKDNKEDPVKPDAKLAEELRSSPETIIIGSNYLMLTTYLWRDFMPIAEEDGSKLFCNSKLTDVDHVGISNSIKLTKLYVIKGDEVWKTNYSEIIHKIDYILEGVASKGPKWGPEIEVDVVCEFESSGKVHRILAKSQWITRTE